MHVDSDTWMPRYFHGNSTIFMGDCAHATSPQLGQGANLALVDAWQLSESVSRFRAASGLSAGKLDKESLLTIAKDYDAARRWRLRFYQLNSKLLTPVFQSNSKIVGTLRDLAMGPLCWLPPTRRQMLTTLVGAQNNGIPWTTIPEDEFMFKA
jgi:2-polyprenyl-6-methoxyphenol hydroxylase-like FAD-dependent oxidoreductase